MLDCADAGHILLSGHVAEDLCQYRHWQPCLHDLGECEVKHGLRLHLFNLHKDNLGNPQVLRSSSEEEGDLRPPLASVQLRLPVGRRLRLQSLFSGPQLPWLSVP